VQLPRQVAFAVLVVNEPHWNIKANVLAREVLRAYFVSQKTPNNVTMPALSSSRAAESKAEKTQTRRGNPTTARAAH
jgi:hypothetical protein